MRILIAEGGVALPSFVRKGFEAETKPSPGWRTPPVSECLVVWKRTAGERRLVSSTCAARTK